MPAQAHAARTYGVLCSKYESGNDPAEIDPNSAYGAYQMSPGNAHTYAVWLKSGADKKTTDDDRAVCIAWGKALVKGYKADGNYTGKKFDKKWAACSKEDSTLFFNTQYTYCKAHYYDEAVVYWKKVASGFNPNNYSSALRCALFSTAVQHGPYGSAYYIFKNALKSIGGWKKSLTEDILIDAVYKERARVSTKAPSGSAIKITSGRCSSSVWKNAKSYGITNTYMVHFYSSPASVQVAIYNRLHNDERMDAFALMKKYGGKCGHKVIEGGTVSYKKSASTDTTHKVTTSAEKCVACGKTVKKKTTKTKSHSFVCKGTVCKCACGTKYVVHKSGCYYYCRAKLNLRVKAKTTAKSLGTVSKKAMVKVESVVKGSDKYWWGKVTVNGKTGYLRMNYLSIHSSGSTHTYVGGICSYCGRAEAQALITKKGKYKASKKTYYYKAAYTSSKKLSTIASGTKVKIVEVVTNCYNELWGVTSGGKYIDLSVFAK